jgi:micrococcal nuclease
VVAVRARPLLVALAVVAGGWVAACGPSTASTDVGTVEHVVDGDTVVVRLGGRRVTIRLLGIDTPEVVAPGRPIGCFGPEASARTKALLPAGTAVRLERDVEGRDAYGRVLAYVYRLPDGLFVNLDLVSGGYAATLRFPPNTAHAAELADALAAARRAGAGLWGACAAFGAPAPG